MVDALAHQPRRGRLDPHRGTLGGGAVAGGAAGGALVTGGVVPGRAGGGEPRPAVPAGGAGAAGPAGASGTGDSSGAGGSATGSGGSATGSGGSSAGSPGSAAGSPAGGGGDGEPPPATAPAVLAGARGVGRHLRFVLVNCATVASLTLGVLAILLAMRGETRTAAAALVGCVILDGADGLLARRLQVCSPFGAQMDSLADMCAFGIAAPVVVYAWVAGSAPAAAAAVACALVAACAAIRLARFNTSPKDSRFFTGLPTTLVAAVLALAVLIDLPVSPTVLLLGVAVLAFAMVSSFPYATLARLLRLPPWLWLAPVAGALVDARLTYLALVAAYLASGPVLWLRQRRTA